MWTEATGVLPEALGAARLERNDGSWVVSRLTGAVNAEWALATLRAGEAALSDPADEVEAVLRTGELHVVVAGAARAVVVRLPASGNVGVALGFAHQQVRAGQERP